MLGDDEMIAPWGRAPPRANRAWQVSRSKSPNMRVSTWTPTVPNYLRCASPDVGHLRDQANSRAEGLRVASKVDREDTSSDVPAIGLTPTELAERQAKRGKLAMMRVAREQAIAKEGTALVAEKRAYARALGKAASSQALSQIKQGSRGLSPRGSRVSEAGDTIQQTMMRTRQGAWDSTADPTGGSPGAEYEEGADVHPCQCLDWIAGLAGELCTVQGAVDCTNPTGHRMS